MANKHLKRCSTLYVVREMQIKKIMTLHCIPVRMVTIQNRQHPVLRRMWSHRNSYCWWEYRTVQSLWKAT